MDEELKRSFHDFYLKLSLLNYKLKTGTKLDENYENQFNIMKHIIPVFNRLLTEKSLTLNSLLNKDIKEEQNNDESYKNKSTEEVNLYSYSVDLFKKINSKSEEVDDDEDSVDEEGDNQVENLTNRSLERLEIIKKDKWIIIEVESDSESDSDNKDNNQIPLEDINLPKDLTINEDKDEEYRVWGKINSYLVSQDFL